MSFFTKNHLRMSDACFALGAAGEYNRPLYRIQLQKFIYLLDIVGYIYETLPRLDGYKTYKNGPYDVTVQNAVDSLAFRGLVKVVNVHTADKGKMRATYALNPAGKSWLEQLIKNNTLNIRWQAALVVAQHVNDFGWQRLVDLVYAEPTYRLERQKGYGQKLVPNNGLHNTAAFLLGTISNGLSYGNNIKSINRELMAELFFRYLDGYDQIISKN